MRSSRQFESQEVVWWAPRSTSRHQHRRIPYLPRDHQEPREEGRLVRSLPASPMDSKFYSHTEPPSYPYNTLPLAHKSDLDAFEHTSNDRPTSSHPSPPHPTLPLRRPRAFSDPLTPRLPAREPDHIYREALAGPELTIMPPSYHNHVSSTSLSTPIIRAPSNTIPENSRPDPLHPIRSQSRFSTRSGASTMATFTHSASVKVDRPFANIFRIGGSSSEEPAVARQESRNAWTGEWNKDIKDVIRELRSLK